MPEVSVVLPTYNRAHTLGASLASVLEQTEVDAEVIVVDDGSTDETGPLLARSGDPRLRVLHEPHRGIAGARNAGVAASRAPYIAFHDSDDLALPGRLARALTLLRADPGIDCVIQNGILLPPEGSTETDPKPWISPTVARTLVDRPIGVAEVYRWNLGQLQGMTFTRTAVLAAGGFDASFEVLEDLDLVLRVAARGGIRFLDAPAFSYRRHGGSASFDRVRVREASIRVAEKLIRDHPAVLEMIGRQAFTRRQARRYARVAHLRFERGDVAGARAALAQARTLAPTNVRYRVQALLLRLRRNP